MTEEGAGVGLLVEDLVRDSLDHCVKCTICESFCPFSNATPLFPGPKYVGPQAERFRNPKEPAPDASVDYCSSCGICTQVCPQGVHIAEMNTRAKARRRATYGGPLRDHLIARPTVAGRLGTPVAPVANWALRNPVLRTLAERALGIDRHAPLPRFAGRTFQSWARRHRSPRGATPRVTYFHACGTNYYEPELGERAVGVLRHNGVAVDVPRQDCCGLPLQSNGLFPEARRYVRRLAHRLLPTARSGGTIVSTNPSCALMLKREAREILGLDTAEMRLLGEHTYDISEFLLGLLDRGELRTDFRPMPLTVAYHAPCQQQGHGIGKPALDLLALIPQLRTIELDALCCGTAGTYGLKDEKYEVAMKVGSDLFGQIETAQPDVVVCDTDTCRWQIEHATGVEAVHPVTMLHRAYGLG